MCCANSCGYKLANDGRDARSIQHYLGHRSIASTVRYTALAPDRFKDFWKDWRRPRVLTQSPAPHPLIYEWGLLLGMVRHDADSERPRGGCCIAGA